MAYKIEYWSRARRELKKLPPQVQQQMVTAMRAPRLAPGGSLRQERAGCVRWA